jgi:hypothetical protein
MDGTRITRLAGVWVLLAMLELLEQHDLNHLRALAQCSFNPQGTISL